MTHVFIMNSWDSYPKTLWGGGRQNLRTALFWVITQRVMIISYRRFGTTYRSHLQESRTQSSVSSSSPEPIGCPETSVRNYHYSLHNSPVECGSHLLRGGSLKLRSRTSITCGSYISSQSTYSRNDRRGYSFYYLDPIIF